MSVKTESELVFEEFCALKAIECEKILQRGAGKHAPSPDYLCALEGVQFVAEVKEIKPIDEERLESNRIRGGVFKVGKLTPGKRVRQKLSKANKQLSVLTKQGKIPGVTVVLDRSDSEFNIAPYNIRVAMYGQQKIIMEIPKNGAGKSRILGSRFGGARKMTPTSNTSTSAVLVIQKYPSIFNGKPYIVVYHNRFAACPIDPKTFRGIAYKQFGLDNVEDSEWQDWQEV